MKFLFLLLSTCLIIVSGQVQYRPKINVKLDDRLQLVKSSNGQIKIMLKSQPASSLFDQHPQQTGQQLVNSKIEIETETETLIEPESVLPISIQPEISPILQELPQTDLPSVSQLDTVGPSIDINPMALTASMVNPALPPIFQLIKNLLKLVCDGRYSNQKFKGFNLLGYNKLCDERNWTESILTNHINQFLTFIQSHIPRVGLTI